MVSVKMKRLNYLLPLLLLLALVTCERKPQSDDLKPGIIRSIGWQGDERAARIFETPAGYILFGSTNSFAPGTYDAVICSIDSNLNLLSEERHGGLGDEIILGAECIRNSSGLVTSYIAWGTVKDAGRSDRDIWLLFTDASGRKTGEQRIQFSSVALDDVPVSLQVSSDALLIACNTVRPGLAGSIETAGWIKTDHAGNIRWRNLLNDTIAFKADGLAESNPNKSMALCHSRSGELRMLEISDPVSPTDTVSYLLLARMQEPGLQEGGQWLVGPDNHFWFYHSRFLNSKEQTFLTRIRANGQFVDRKIAGNGDFERPGRVCLQTRSTPYPVNWLSSRRPGLGSAQEEIGVYFNDRNGIRLKEPMYFGGSFSNVPADLVQTRDGGLLLLGTHTAPNRPGGDFVLYRLNRGGALP
jgi:hypothetical protein